jgi:HTH-type transcriptional regulator / antitoxin HipB
MIFQIKQIYLDFRINQNYTIFQIIGEYAMATLIRSPGALGNMIQRARKQKGWSQAELGEHTNMRQSAVSMIEKGQAALKLDTLLTIVAALDLDLQIGPRARGSIEDFAGML